MLSLQLHVKYPHVVTTVERSLCYDELHKTGESDKRQDGRADITRFLPPTLVALSNSFFVPSDLGMTKLVTNDTFVSGGGGVAFA
jgi:hypothetical protein